MAELFREMDFEEKRITCPRCRWSGPGNETVVVDLYGLAKRKEVHCPSCDAYLGGLDPDDGRDGESPGSFSFQLG